MTLKEKILQLRDEGKSYSVISDELQCTKGIISYHCNALVKQKTKGRTKRWRKENTLKTKIRNFNNPNQRKRTTYGNVRNPNLKEECLLRKFGPNPKCYLTGVPINLDNPEEYSLDHITPISKGGTNDISNCGLASKKANMLKNDLTYEELLSVCRTILENHEKNGGPSPHSSGEPLVYETSALSKG